MGRRTINIAKPDSELRKLYLNRFLSESISDLNKFKFDTLRRTLGKQTSSYSRILCFAVLIGLIFSRFSGFKRTLVQTVLIKLIQNVIVNCTLCYKFSTN